MKGNANPVGPAPNGAVTRVSATGAAHTPTPPTAAVKLSVSVGRDVGTRLRRLAFDERVSESSIVEIALEALFRNRTDAQLGAFLRDNGASLRRPVRATDD